MLDARPMASLTSGLLARKGSARPAMRSSLHGGQLPAPATDDLGWNDFGNNAAPEPASSEPPCAVIVPIAAAAEAAPVASQVETPVIVRQQRAIADAVANHEVVSIAHSQPTGTPSTGAPAVRKSALSQGRRAAFTLRLDAERHLALRVAATVLGRSAQQIVSDALDEMIARHPEINVIAGQIHGRR